MRTKDEILVNLLLLLLFCDEKRKLL